MFIKSKIFRVISLFCLISTLTAFAFADTIRLKDGSIIKGKIVSFDGGKFIVLIDDGTRQRTLNFTAEEIESIIFESGSIPVPTNTSRHPPVTTTEGNTTIITVGQNRQNTNDLPENNSTDENVPEPSTPKVITDSSNTPPTIKNNTVITAKPITITVPVLADNTSNGWTNSGWVVKKGQKIKIKGSGRIALGNGRFSNPNGISSLPDTNKLIKEQATGGLIAVIGADNNEFIFIGDTYEFVAARDGDLFLGINEGNLNDNSGSYDVTIEIDPNLNE